MTVPGMSDYKNSFSNMMADKFDTITEVITELGVKPEEIPRIVEFAEFGAEVIRGGRPK
jgi:hypothetical protein